MYWIGSIGKYLHAKTVFVFKAPASRVISRSSIGTSVMVNEIRVAVTGRKDAWYQRPLLGILVEETSTNHET